MFPYAGRRSDMGPLPSRTTGGVCARSIAALCQRSYTCGSYQGSYQGHSWAGKELTLHTHVHLMHMWVVCSHSVHGARCVSSLLSSSPHRTSRGEPLEVAPSRRCGGRTFCGVGTFWRPAALSILPRRLHLAVSVPSSLELFGVARLAAHDSCPAFMWFSIHAPPRDSLARRRSLRRSAFFISRTMAVPPAVALVVR